MNKEQAKEWLPLIQAAVDGKALQLKVFAWVEGQLTINWIDVCGDIDFQISPSRLRIKPTPLKAWYRVALYKNGTVGLFTVGDDLESVTRATHFSQWLTKKVWYEMPEDES